MFSRVGRGSRLQLCFIYSWLHHCFINAKCILIFKPSWSFQSSDDLFSLLTNNIKGNPNQVKSTNNHPFDFAFYLNKSKHYVKLNSSLTYIERLRLTALDELVPHGQTKWLPELLSVPKRLCLFKARDATVRFTVHAVRVRIRDLVTAYRLGHGHDAIIIVSWH